MRVFTNGCFDVMHLGHVELLKYCKSLGRVIVGVNSDESVRRLKGPGRPINNEVARVEMLQSLRFVDEVHIFDEDTPHNLIRSLMPDVIVKGGDYRPEDVVGGDLAQVLIFDLRVGYSTTNVIEQMSILEQEFRVEPSGIVEASIHPKGWGHEEWLINNTNYCGKILNFDKGKKCSFHYHKLKTETFYVESGEVLINYSWGDDLELAEKRALESGQVFHVPQGLRHQIFALNAAKIFEFSTMHLESDSYRIVKGD
jgi:rfaE bifunctional protein nucleotidyltransferase chain/domain